MTLIRRQPAPAQGLHKAVLGELKFRRVWLKAEPLGKTNNQHTHWYVDARSAEGAINEMARRTRKPAHLFDSAKD